jgi:hypothetical protein
VAEPGEADLAVVNTCTVTAAAASDSRQKVRHISRSGVDQIVVTGCWSSLHPESAAALPAVSHVVPNQDKDTLVANLLSIPEAVFDLEPVARQAVPGAHLRTRAFIKVQDGCDNRCTFCVTTLARGPGAAGASHRSWLIFTPPWSAIQMIELPQRDRPDWVHLGSGEKTSPPRNCATSSRLSLREPAVVVYDFLPSNPGIWTILFLHSGRTWPLPPPAPALTIWLLCDFTAHGPQDYSDCLRCPGSICPPGYPRNGHYHGRDRRFSR